MRPLPGGTGDGGVPAATPAVRMAAGQLARAALSRVRDSRGLVRVEDYLAVMAALTGEAALVAAEVFDIETTTMPPGAAVFGDKINANLSGDGADVAKAPLDSVIGIMVRELVPDTAPLALFPPLDGLYRGVAENVGKSPWGNVATSVSSQHKPGVVPLQVAFELRGAVDAAQREAGLPRSLRHAVCALALADSLKRVKEACDMSMALTLSLEIVFGMAKMVPMSRAAFESVRKQTDA